MGDEDLKDTTESYLVFQKMESLFEKLKSLNYEKEFVRKQKQKPINKHYFAISTNPGDQFHTWTLLAHWIITKLCGKMDFPQEYEDPNVIIANILDHTRKISPVIDIVPSKLKSGSGEACVSVLLALAEFAVMQSRPSFPLPKYPDENKLNTGYEIVDISNNRVNPGESTEWIEDERLLYGAQPSGALNNQEEDLYMIDEMLEVPNLLDVSDDESGQNSGLRAYKNKKQSSGKSSASPASEMMLLPDSLIKLQDITNKTISSTGIMPSPKDSAKWLFELERAIPQLKISIKASETRDWRTHLEQMMNHKKEISSSYEKSHRHLIRLREDVTRSIDKIQSREKHLNHQLDAELSVFRETQDQFELTKKAYKERTKGIQERAQILSDISDELDRVKLEMEERGSSMTDGSPLERIQKAISRLKTEIVSMNIRTGVLEHMIMRAISQNTGLSSSMPSEQVETILHSY